MTQKIDTTNNECNVTDSLKNTTANNECNVTDSLKNTMINDNHSSDSESEDSGQASKIKFFKMIDPKTGESLGRFSGSTADHAAYKAFIKIMQNKKNTSQDNSES
ncbi:hypothetical protein QJ856_gp1249 [Tupanvirus deep ocean]|uniref:Uncharacterized protein n=2 Tax=Tupanvirus TaxID=2094720 RepID=A0AC62A707_9VIRU|nr:hypothetical protein QJ856_gp1249 [Tupanvirus deep ocean]QKU33516.1 hypothetical protein [Tupanvirus deep ocean]